MNVNPKIINTLVSYGLSEIEAKVYYIALALEDGTADRIARQAEIHRTTAYPVFDRLRKIGLISQIKKKGKTVFRAAQPERLIDLLNEKKENIESVMPDLKSLFEINRGRPEVKFFEGKEGLKTVFNSILNEAKEILIFSDGESFIKSIPGWTEAYVKRRASKNIKIKIILKASPFAINSIKKIHIDSQLDKLFDIRVLPEAYKINYSGFDVYNNKVVLYSFEKQNNAVVIESALINQLMTTVFEILWETAEKYNRLIKF